MAAYILRIRTTYDQVRVVVWNDGELTDGAGRGFCRARLSLTAAIMAAEEAQLFDAAELPVLLRAAARLEKEGKLNPGALRTAATTEIEKQRRKEEARS